MYIQRFIPVCLLWVIFLASLTPSTSRHYDTSRYLLIQYIVWVPPVLRFMLKSAKNMQAASDLQLIDPLFCTVKDENKIPLTATAVRSTLYRLIRKFSFNTHDFGSHAFLCSGVPWVFNNNVPMDYMKSHGH